jgi:hypothetical protein
MGKDDIETDTIPLQIVPKPYRSEKLQHRRPVLMTVIDTRSRAIIGVQIRTPDSDDSAPRTENA